MPGDKPLIPTIRADFPSFGSKLVHPSAKLPEAASGETWFFTIIKWRKAEKGEMKGQKETQQASRASVLMSLYWLISVWLAPTKHLLVLQLELRSIFKEGGVETDRAKSGRGQLMHVNEQAIQEQQRTVEEWTQCLDEIHVRIGPRFARAEQRRRVPRDAQRDGPCSKQG